VRNRAGAYRTDRIAHGALRLLAAVCRPLGDFLGLHELIEVSRLSRADQGALERAVEAVEAIVENIRAAQAGIVIAPLRRSESEADVSWDDIPGWSGFLEIYDLAVDEAPQEGGVIVELGVAFGARSRTCRGA